MQTAYRTVAQLLHRLPLPAGKLAESLGGRRAAPERWRAWADEDRRDGRRLWLHAASVGEALAAEPVVRRLRDAIPGLRAMLTYTSPSATRWDDLAGADHADYLPLDEPRPIERTLDALRPDLLLFSRGDLWPELVHRAHARGVPVAVTGGVVRPRSGRLRWPVRLLLQSVHRQVDWVGAVTVGDADRWRRLGVRPEAVEVTGDPGHDRVLDRTARPGRLEALLAWAAAHRPLVAGSVEPSDERVILSAARTVLAARPDAGLVIVPHDVGAATTRRLVAAAADIGLEAAVWTPGGPRPGVSCVVAAATGLLFDLYGLAALAYVGGGFRRGALHAVIEPAAHALPVLFGPWWDSSPDAAALLASGGGIALSAGDPHGSLVAAWTGWLADASRRAAAGAAARAVLRPGAADRSAQRLARFLIRSTL